jgi:tRNA(Ile)-lysidine synthase
MAPDGIGLSPEDAVNAFLAKLTRPAHLLVAVSGGSDSAGLLLALSKYAPSPEVTISAATIDHALRAESADEARVVAAMCARLGLAQTIRRWEGDKPLTGISAAAREARYGLLSEIAGELGADAILTGHTADDQAETIAMRTARGGGGERTGLAGMADAVLLERRHWLLRPFLRTTRADIRAFLTGHGETWIDDPSNLNAQYERVRVRLAGANAAMDGEAAATRKDLADRAAALLGAHVRVQHGVLAHMTPAGLTEDLPALRHALAALGAVLGGRTHALGSDSMTRVLAFIQGGQAGRLTAGRVIFDRRRDGLYMMRERRDMPSLHISPGQTNIWDGRFRIANRTRHDVVVRATVPHREEALEAFPDAPPAIAMRAASALPFVDLVSKAAAATGRDTVLCTPILAPYDRFLPQFDLTLANELALLIGCEAFPPVPIKDSRRKS